MAITYHQLGITAQDRGRLDEADDWYRKSLTIKEELGDRPGMATTYHQLGMTAQARGRLDEADDWYRKSLTINEELGDRPGMATTYHQLGITAQDRGRLDEAERLVPQIPHHQRRTRQPPGMALTYAQLGLLAEERGQRPLALEWNIRCVTLFDQFPHPMTGTGPAALARLTRQLGMPALEQAWQQVTGQPVPQPVRDYITSHQRRRTRRRAMTDPAADAARSAAAILAPDLGPNLPAEVEAALAARDAQQRPDRYLDPVSLASLIVAIATLAWTIYNDQRNHTPDPPPAPSPARSASPCASRTRPCPRHRAHHRNRRHRDHPPGQPTRITRAQHPQSTDSRDILETEGTRAEGRGSVCGLFAPVGAVYGATVIVSRQVTGAADGYQRRNSAVLPAVLYVVCLELKQTSPSASPAGMTCIRSGPRNMATALCRTWQDSLPRPAPDTGAGQRREGRERGLRVLSGTVRLCSPHWLPE